MGIDHCDLFNLEFKFSFKQFGHSAASGKDVPKHVGFALDHDSNNAHLCTSSSERHRHRNGKNYKLPASFAPRSPTWQFTSVVWAHVA
jgi:hypothetical protein